MQVSRGTPHHTSPFPIDPLKLCSEVGTSSKTLREAGRHFLQVQVGTDSSSVDSVVDLFSLVVSSRGASVCVCWACGSVLLGGFCVGCVGRGRGWWVRAAAAPAVVAADAASLSLAKESPSSLVAVNSQWNSCLGTAYRTWCFKTSFEGVPQTKRWSPTIGTGSADR